MIFDDVLYEGIGIESLRINQLKFATSKVHLSFEIDLEDIQESFTMIAKKCDAKI